MPSVLMRDTENKRRAGDDGNLGADGVTQAQAQERQRLPEAGRGRKLPLKPPGSTALLTP